MTAITRRAAPRHAQAAARRRRFVWVAWRQHRAAIAAAIVVLAGIGLLLLVTGLQMHSAWHALPRECRTPQELHGDTLDANDPCGPRPTAFISHHVTLRVLMPHALMFLPALLGAFVGGPLVGRELESGTYKFAWTQGIDRVRWLLTKLLVVGVLLGTAAVGFSLLYTWWYAPLAAGFGRIRSLEAYELEGTVFAARTLFAFAAGVLFGAVLRRSVPAMVATLVAGIGVILASTIWLRPLIQHAIVTPRGSSIADANQYTSWNLGGGFRIAPGATSARPNSTPRLLHLTQPSRPSHRLTRSKRTDGPTSPGSSPTAGSGTSRSSSQSGTRCSPSCWVRSRSGGSVDGLLSGASVSHLADVAPLRRSRPEPRRMPARMSRRQLQSGPRIVGPGCAPFPSAPPGTRTR